MKIFFALVLAIFLLPFVSDPAIAQTFFPASKTFTVTRPCNATTSLSGKNPVALTVGKNYVALGENSFPGSHAWITRTGTDNRWVPLSCGTYGTVSGGGGTNLPAGTVPFFDNTNNPVSGLKFGGSADVTPVAPILNDFDKAVVTLCGAPGKVVSRDDFRAVMGANPTVLASIRAAVSPSNSAFLDELTDVWFNVKGFDHVFCGEPVAGGSIGGLHFVGRYMDLQAKGLAGRLANNLSNEEVLAGAVYTMGAKVKVGSLVSESLVKGYGYTLDAEDLLRLGAIAYKKNPNTTAINTACLLPVVDDNKSFKMVFVARDGGLRTFYPDATPSGSLCAL